MIKRLIELYHRQREASGFARIVRHHRNAGSATPEADAHLELTLRAFLEEFRDFASERYLKSEPLDSIKDDWIKENRRRITTVTDKRSATLMVNVIRDMPARECLSGAALQAWIIKAGKTVSDYRKMVQQRHGPTMMSDHARRVLRS